MAHVLAPQPAAPELPLFFNVDGVVGAAPAANKREDVLLVQYFLRLIADEPTAETDPANVAAGKLVKVTGVIDPATVNAIRVNQEVRRKKHPNVVVDGRVSPAKGGYYYGALWTIVLLNKSVQSRHPEVWPRFDKLSNCPAELKEMVKRTLVGGT